MPKKTTAPVERRHVHLFVGDWQELQALYGDSVGPSEAIRLIVHKTLRKVRDRAAERSRPIAPEGLDLEDLET